MLQVLPEATPRRPPPPPDATLHRHTPPPAECSFWALVSLSHEVKATANRHFNISSVSKTVTNRLNGTANPFLKMMVFI